MSSTFLCLSCRPPHTIYRGLPTYASRRLLSAPVFFDVKRLNYPTRGQNLSERYLRLEKSLRAKQSLLESTPVASKTVQVDAHRIHPLTESQRDTSNSFHGFKIPVKPKPPESGECCMSGCAVCVYDLYQDSLAVYNESLTSLRSSLSNMHIPESEWPREVLNSAGDAGFPHNKDVTLSAFEELERALREKRSAGVDPVKSL